MSELLLEVVEGPQAGTQVPVTGQVEAGRSPEAVLTLDDDQASRHPARFDPSGAGVMVSDLGSTNGTYVNEQPIHAPRELRAGDRVRLGLTVLELRSPDQVKARPSAVSPVPPFAAPGQQVLAPASDDQLPARAAPAPPNAPPGEAYAALAALVDTRVKRQTAIAVFALLSAAGLAVLILFGVR